MTEVLQYYTLPDLGLYVRARMVCQSSMVPTGLATQSTNHLQPGNTSITGGGRVIARRGEKRQKHTLAGEVVVVDAPSSVPKSRRGAGGTVPNTSSSPSAAAQKHTHTDSVCIMTAAAHSCCPSSGQQARYTHTHSPHTPDVC